MARAVPRSAGSVRSARAGATRSERAGVRLRPRRTCSSRTHVRQAGLSVSGFDLRPRVESASGWLMVKLIADLPPPALRHLADRQLHLPGWVDGWSGGRVDGWSGGGWTGGWVVGWWSRSNMYGGRRRPRSAGARADTEVVLCGGDGRTFDGVRVDIVARDDGRARLYVVVEAGRSRSRWRCRRLLPENGSVGLGRGRRRACSFEPRPDGPVRLGRGATAADLGGSGTPDMFVRAPTTASNMFGAPVSAPDPTSGRRRRLVDLLRLSETQAHSPSRAFCARSFRPAGAAPSPGPGTP